MADQDEAKTRTIGYLPKEKVRTVNGWNEYLKNQASFPA